MSIHYTLSLIDKKYKLNIENIEKYATNKYDLDFVFNFEDCEIIIANSEGYGYYKLTKEKLIQIIEEYKSRLIELNLEYHKKVKNDNLTKEELLIMFATKITILSSKNFLNLDSNEIEMSSSILTEHLIFNLINFYKRISIDDLIILKID